MSTEDRWKRWPRWTTEGGYSDLSVAVDEIYRLRAMLADEAMIIEAHLGYKSFPKSRRAIAEDQVERMSAAARGEEVRRDRHEPKRALRLVGASECLTNQQWADQRGLVPIEPKGEGDGDDGG